jgi:ketosteroid isomerase-like protein
MVARRIAAVSLVAIAVACSQPPPPAPKPDAAAVKATLAPFWTKMAAAEVACDANALGSMVTTDAKFDGAGMALNGRAAYVSLVQTQCKTTKFTNFNTSPSEDWADGDHLYERGTFTEGSMTGNKGKTEYGKYFVQFDKDSTGNVWMSRGAFMTDSTPALKMTKAPAKAAPTKAPAKAPAKRAASKKS